MSTALCTIGVRLCQSSSFIITRDHRSVNQIFEKKTLSTTTTRMSEVRNLLDTKATCTASGDGDGDGGDEEDFADDPNTNTYIQKFAQSTYFFFKSKLYECTGPR